MASIQQNKPKSQENQKEYRSMKPLPCVGTYEQDMGVKYASMFLGFEQMTVQERADGKCVCKGIVPVPIRDEIEPAIQAAMKVTENNAKNIYKSWSGSMITDRDGGFYDSLENIFAWASKVTAKKQIYESLRLSGSCESPYHGILNSMEKFADLKVTGLLVEVADRPSQYSMALGAAVLVVKKESLESSGRKWKMNAVRAEKIMKEVRSSDEAKLVKCTMDELVGLAFASGLPIIIADSTYNPVSVDGVLEKTSNPLNSKIVMTAPYFGSVDEAKAWRTLKKIQRNELEKKRKKTAKVVVKAMDIKDASAFLSMRTSEKRACLRASGVYELPRPREGPRAVDAFMIPLLDEEVAYEVLRRLAETKGDFAEAAEMEDYESKKPKLARAYKAASESGDRVLAAKLSDEMNSLATLRFDPTNPENTGANMEFDVEQWYYEARVRVYGIIAAV
eukprot:CAMPEP_0119050976 /NCGR_PEP_ID=MMETSP1177-20130426/72743_1 /TAXON_ID=2985 /ORGANISM="Ochromonas sp, Strain CCMP1899" /LENGTH=448 /DNA_ID=CAMNT_0007030019 /DNA_START=328 /DNA_END=1674 /DNA_ORIENTATION=+